MPLPPLPSDLDADFPAALVQGARELGVDPVGAAALLYVESGIKPGATNPRGGAIGINQFDPPTQVLHYGFSSVAEYAHSSACVQFQRAVMPFWRALVQQFGHGQTKFSARDLYWLNFLPATYVANAPEDHVITSNPAWVTPNPGLARGKSYIAASDITHALNAVMNSTSPRWVSIRANVEAAEQASGGGGGVAQGAGTFVGGLALVGFGYAAMKGWLG